MAGNEPAIEKFDQGCYLVRNALTTSEQTCVFEDILERSRKTDNATTKTVCMHPNPKTIIFDGGMSTLRFGPNDGSVYSGMVQKVNGALLRCHLQSCDTKGEIMTMDGVPFENSGAIRHGSVISMGTIRYPAPNGRFPEHIDHCTDSWVYLLSLGCTANFVVKGPSMEKRVFAFRSGDVLVFDASTEAAVLHGVRDIDAESCPEELSETFGSTMQKHRFGI